jgi:NADH-quinone oxidoreductase subunit L
VFAAADEIRFAGEATAAGHDTALEVILLGIAALIALGGVFVAYRAFLVNTAWPKRVRTSLGGFGKLVENKYRVDELYSAAIVAPTLGLARWFAGPVDQRTIDGAVNGLAGLTGSLGERVRRLQVGQVGIYALSMLFGAVAIIIWLAVQ